MTTINVVFAGGGMGGIGQVGAIQAAEHNYFNGRISRSGGPKRPLQVLRQ